MSQTSRARVLAPIAGFSHQQAMNHLQALTIGPRGENEYIAELRTGATVEPITCDCGREFLVAFNADGIRTTPTDFQFGFDPRNGQLLRVTDTCPRCTLIYSMVEWFSENFDDPSHPAEKAFRAATLRMGIVIKAEQEVSRTDAREILHTEFPEAPMDVVGAACERVYGDGGDWVRKPRVKVYDATGWKAHTDD